MPSEDPAVSGLAADRAVVLVVGPEEILADRAVAEVLHVVRQRDPGVTVVELDAAAYDKGQLATIASPSLFGGSTLVLVSGVEAANDAFVVDATAYVREPADDVVLVLRHAGGVRAKALLDAAIKAGASRIDCARLKDGEKPDFVLAEFRRSGGRITGPAARALVDAVGSDLRELAAACAQLVEVVGGSVDVEDVDRYHGGRVEASGFRVADAAVAGHTEQALGLLRHAMATGVDAAPLVGALAVKLRTIAKVAAVGRARPADAAKQLGLAPWQVDRARRELPGWTPAGLAEAICAVADADTAIKGGGRDRVYALEKCLIEIGRARAG